MLDSFLLYRPLFGRDIPLLYSGLYFSSSIQYMRVGKDRDSAIVLRP